MTLWDGGGWGRRVVYVRLHTQGPQEQHTWLPLRAVHELEEEDQHDEGEGYVNDEEGRDIGERRVEAVGDVLLGDGLVLEGQSGLHLRTQHHIATPKVSSTGTTSVAPDKPLTMLKKNACTTSMNNKENLVAKSSLFNCLPQKCT
jgi:hypothetical protein